MISRRTLLVLVTMLLVALPVAVQRTSGNTGPQSTCTKAGIRSTLEQLYAAWSNLDPAKAALFYAKDADLIFFDIAPMKYTGWSEYAAGVPKAFAPYKSGVFRLNGDLQVHCHGNLAWAVATWQGKLIMKAGGTESMEGRYTAVLQKRGTKWLIVHEHMSVPPPAPR